MRRNATLLCLALALATNGRADEASPQVAPPAPIEISVRDAQEVSRARELLYVDPRAALAIYRGLLERHAVDAHFPDCDSEEQNCTLGWAVLGSAWIAECLLKRGLPPRFEELGDLLAAMQVPLRAGDARRLGSFVPCELAYVRHDSCNVGEVEAAPVMTDVLARLPKLELSALPREDPLPTEDRVEVDGERATLYFMSTPQQTLEFQKVGGSWRWSGYGTEDSEFIQHLWKKAPLPSPQLTDQP